MAYLEIKHLQKSYENKKVLNDINLSVNEGELVSILGPSGCGKTTTLRIIAGLLDKDDGEILLSGNDLSEVPVHKRNLGMVFQSYALFPHLNVFENVAFGLKMRHLSKNEIQDKVNEILDITNLFNLKDRYPSELSGGQQQRVSLARGLVIKPKLLLMDEPLSNLDAKLRIQMREEIKRLQNKLGITTIFVTHDQEECFVISDHVAVMNKGRIEQFDIPQNIYNHPKTKFVADFIGYENLFEIDSQDTTAGQYSIAGKKLISDFSVKNVRYLTIKPDQINISKNDDDKNNLLSGKIIERIYLGRGYRYNVKTEIGIIKVDDQNSDDLFNLNDEVFLNLRSHSLLPLSK